MIPSSSICKVSYGNISDKCTKLLKHFFLKVCAAVSIYL